MNFIEQKIKGVFLIEPSSFAGVGTQKNIKSDLLKFSSNV